MFEHLKIKDFKVIREASLLHLGRINIICGKNNSGKSTLLAGISSNNRLSGKTLIKDRLSSLSILPTVWFPRGGSTQGAINSFKDLDEKSGIKNFQQKYFKSLELLISGKQIWFMDEANSFEAALEITSLSVSRKNMFEKVHAEISKIFQKELSHNFETIMIPPKRNLESEGQYVHKKSRDLRADGSNLLSHLYWLKNKERHSSEFKLYEKLRDAFQKVSSGHNFNITRDDDDKLILRFSLMEQDEIEADDCGLGLQDLLLILYFAINDEHHVILIEEPENHMHPEMQKKLLQYLKDETDKQYFLTTHSNVFLNSVYVDRIFFTKFENGEIKISDETKLAEILQDIGYSVAENIVSDLIILVEGPSDTPVIEEFLNKLRIDRKYNIKIWALGGDIMEKQDLSIFAERYKVMALIDNDPKSKKSRQKFIKNCEDLSIPVTRLKKYAIENYFRIDALKKVFKGQISNELETIDEDTPLFNQIGIDVKKNNRKIAKEMKLEDIEGTDLMMFFESVRTELESL